MLVIREAQLRAFQEDRDRAFVRWLAGGIRRDDPAPFEGWSDALLEQRVAAVLPRARGAGLHEPLAIREFFMASALLSPRFDEAPSVRAVLDDASTPPDLRIYRVWKLPPEVIRAEVAALAPETPQSGADQRR